MSWTNEEPTVAGWYWLTHQEYAGSERWTYQGMRLVYVQIKEVFLDGESQGQEAVFYAKLGQHDKPAAKLDNDWLRPLFMGPIKAPEKPEGENQ